MSCMALGRCRPQCLGHTEIDHLDHRNRVVHRYKDVGRFQIAVDDAFLMGVPHRLTDRQEKLQSLSKRELITIAKVGNRCALNQLHDEVGPAGGGLSAVEDAGNVGMLHQCQRLPLGFEAGDHLPRIHAGLDDLDGDAPPNRRLLLGQVDDAEAALAKRFQQPIRAKDRSRSFSDRRLGEQADRRLFQKGTGSEVIVDQFFQFTAQSGIGAARLIEKGGPFLGGLQGDGLGKQSIAVAHDFEIVSRARRASKGRVTLACAAGSDDVTLAGAACSYVPMMGLREIVQVKFTNALLVPSLTKTSTS